MAKTQKFAEELLLDAVVRYAEICHTKIKTTELAEWARNNIIGLEEVRDYHFNRPMYVKNQKTGKREKQKKACTIKIDEINSARSLNVVIERNVLLHSSSIDEFFKMPLSAQRKTIAEARESVDKLSHKNIRLTIDNQVLNKSNKELKEKLVQAEESIKKIQKKQDLIQKQINYILKHTDELERKKMLKQMGVGDGYYDIEQFIESINGDVGEVFNITEALKKYRESEMEVVEERSMIDKIFSGINKREE